MGMARYGLKECHQLKGIEKEMSIVAKRGEGVDYQVKKDTPLLNNRYDIRRTWPGKFWDEMKSQ